MLHWPFVLVAPYVIIKRRALPDRYFSSAGQHRSGSVEAPDTVRERPDASLTAQQYRDALRLAMDQLPDSSPVTQLQYRSALRLAMDQLSSVKMDRDLQELLMRQLKSLEELGQQGG